jgi:hypothetical protein
MAARGSTRRRRQRRGDGLVLKLMIPVSLLAMVGVVGFLVLRPAATPTALAPSPPPCPLVSNVVVGDISVPSGPIAGYCQPQLIIAAQIMLAAEHWTPDVRAKQIGVMTAIGESDLQNLDYGDTVGPDSRGIFQQRSNWGTLAQRMDPYTAAYDFYARMFGVVNWNTLPPTIVAHTVQRNADPNYYTKYFSRAKNLVAGLLAHELPPVSISPVPSG